jgi:hypothetical protein
MTTAILDQRRNLGPRVSSGDATLSRLVHAFVGHVSIVLAHAVFEFLLLGEIRFIFGRRTIGDVPGPGIVALGRPSGLTALVDLFFAHGQEIPVRRSDKRARR